MNSDSGVGEELVLPSNVAERPHLCVRLPGRRGTPLRPGFRWQGLDLSLDRVHLVRKRGPIGTTLCHPPGQGRERRLEIGAPTVVDGNLLHVYVFDRPVRPRNCSVTYCSNPAASIAAPTQSRPFRFALHA